MMNSYGGKGGDLFGILGHDLPEQTVPQNVAGGKSGEVSNTINAVVGNTLSAQDLSMKLENTNTILSNDPRRNAYDSDNYQGFQSQGNTLPKNKNDLENFDDPFGVLDYEE